MNRNFMLRKHILSISVLTMVLSSGIIYGQGSNLVRLSLSLKEGEARKYHITSTTKSFTEGGGHEAMKSTEKDVTIKILAISHDKINIEWSYDMIMFIDSVSQSNLIWELLNTLNKGMIIKYVVNSQGTIQSISNYNEITLNVKQQVDGMIHRMSQDNGIDASLVKTLKFQFEMILTSKELLDALILEDVYNFHELYGLSFQKGNKNLIPEKFLPNDGYEVELVSSDKNKCRLEGKLLSSFSDKTGQKIYEFELPSYWLEHYSSKWYATIPMTVSNYYSMTLISPQ